MNMGAEDETIAMRQCAALAREHIAWCYRPRDLAAADNRLVSGAYVALQAQAKSLGRDVLTRIYRAQQTVFEDAYLAQLDAGESERQAWLAGVEALRRASSPLGGL
jgi:hypothetical protein